MPSLSLSTKQIHNHVLLFCELPESTEGVQNKIICVIGATMDWTCISSVFYIITVLAQWFVSLATANSHI